MQVRSGDQWPTYGPDMDLAVALQDQPSTIVVGHDTVDALSVSTLQEWFAGQSESQLAITEGITVDQLTQRLRVQLGDNYLAGVTARNAKQGEGWDMHAALVALDKGADPTAVAEQFGVTVHALRRAIVTHLGQDRWAALVGDQWAARFTDESTPMTARVVPSGPVHLSDDERRPHTKAPKFSDEQLVDSVRAACQWAIRTNRLPFSVDLYREWRERICPDAPASATVLYRLGSMAELAEQFGAPMNVTPTTVRSDFIDAESCWNSLYTFFWFCDTHEIDLNARTYFEWQQGRPHPTTSIIQRRCGWSNVRAAWQKWKDTPPEQRPGLRSTDDELPAPASAGTPTATPSEAPAADVRRAEVFLAEHTDEVTAVCARHRLTNPRPHRDGDSPDLIRLAADLTGDAGPQALQTAAIELTRVCRQAVTFRSPKPPAVDARTQRRARLEAQRAKVNAPTWFTDIDHLRRLDSQSFTAGLLKYLPENPHNNVLWDTVCSEVGLATRARTVLGSADQQIAQQLAKLRTGYGAEAARDREAANRYKAQVVARIGQVKAAQQHEAFAADAHRLSALESMLRTAVAAVARHRDAVTATDREPTADDLDLWGILDLPVDWRDDMTVVEDLLTVPQSGA